MWRCDNKKRVNTISFQISGKTIKRFLISKNYENSLSSQKVWRCDNKRRVKTISFQTSGETIKRFLISKNLLIYSSIHLKTSQPAPALSVGKYPNSQHSQKGQS
jgi:hypothetical protein